MVDWCDRQEERAFWLCATTMLLVRRCGLLIDCGGAPLANCARSVAAVAARRVGSVLVDEFDQADQVVCEAKQSDHFFCTAAAEQTTNARAEPPKSTTNAETVVDVERIARTRSLYYLDNVVSHCVARASIQEQRAKRRAAMQITALALLSASRTRFLLVVVFLIVLFNSPTPPQAIRVALVGGRAYQRCPFAFVVRARAFSTFRLAHHEKRRFWRAFRSLSCEQLKAMFS